MATSSASHVPDAPSDIDHEDTVTTLQCHPTENILASGLISGDIVLSSFDVSESNQELKKFPHHKKASRALRFSEDGRRLYSVSKDKSLLCFDVETGKLKKRIRNAHESSIYSMVVTGTHFVATGDDDGVLKVWDMRTKEATVEMKECEDFISDMVVDDNKKIIIASSGEGTLTAFNIRRKRMELQSELFDSEMLCLAKMKQGQKLICGTGEGTLSFFNWGEWGNISDRFPCGEAEINCIMPVTEYIAVIGTDDGYIRAVHVLPNRVLGVVGQHMENFPVEAMSKTADGTCVTTCSHDQHVKFWNIEELKRQKVDTSKKGSKKGKKFLKFSKAKKDDFFSGLVDMDRQDEDHMDSDDLDEDSD
ncbi:hypothetical protein RRG08_018738 [Elysia crispata]|uniref:WD repeat-containing protein 55 homolog n=1 Tax=Elysia crispata TaxID=231223 RepID=A0AAE0XTK1_9GAST|nr:hypothetical protein RRG08_018738 [Elysia crispata]